MKARLATIADLDDLHALENKAFTHDRLDRRRWRHLLKDAHGQVWVAEDKTKLLGAAVLLLKKGTALARLYSLAVDPAARGRGIAKLLMEKIEAAAITEGSVAIRLEVQGDNVAAIGLYERFGFKTIAPLLAYYEDGSDGLRMEKRIKGKLPKGSLKVPFYPQQTRFTCGPSCLLMALSALKKKHKPRISDELNLWRESTTIYMTSGHGGCSGEGLALAAAAQGLEVGLCVSDREVPFIEGVRNPEKKRIITVVHEDFSKRLKKAGIQRIYQRLELDALARHLDGGGLALVLISTYLMHNEKAPHWVLVVAMDQRFVYLHDPDLEDVESVTDNIAMPVPLEAFLRMARLGRRQYSAALLLR
ncbi:GNAT family N-acetyltransferase/peptidase C39 family protein [Gallaecimonas pentaromativorans]|uniref:Ribosomal protein S18 acetylase RimI-like enzyme n=1 Tax=Gallaecimonas pentaromativorans TaxID=584787 RepID=A0A3N1PC60_9GAMM|nr:GNAT family N-acetyltransferase/peptidase C39 family protein [Gallaecimonas pentaromativorans]ROQ24971.1 ribosomal protein S18 acetylase RimI-like enzyme [Gallaecimonas pentaromativorans]